MGVQVRELRDIIRDEMLMRNKVLAVLSSGPKTVPEIAEAMVCPVREAMLWVMSARKYGYVKELEEPTDEGYYKYRLPQDRQEE